MSRETQQRHEPIGGRAELIDYFLQGAKPPEARRVGMEHELLGYTRGDDSQLRALSYEDHIAPLMRAFAARFGWQPVVDAGHITALERDGAAITIEPGGQFELSGAVLDSLAATEAELHGYLDALLELSAPLGVQWLLAGARPFDALDDVPWMPKSRYRLMARYLPTRGALAPEMMKLTATVQANFDYTDEADAMAMLRVATHATPVVSALFASSPLRLGQPSGDVTRRCRIWTDTDPDRTGLLRGMYEPGYSLATYVDYLLDMPMICIRRDDEGYIDATGLSFRRYVDEGLRGHRATIGDWEMHLSMAWPEVRLKRYMEVRGADLVAPPLMLSLVALWKGILYDPQARADTLALSDQRTFDAHRALHLRMIQGGLAAAADAPGQRLLDLGRDLVEIAAAGLTRQSGDADEARYLEPLRALVLTPGASIGEQLLARYHATPDPHAAVAPLWLAHPVDRRPDLSISPPVPA